MDGASGLLVLVQRCFTQSSAIPHDPSIVANLQWNWLMEKQFFKNQKNQEALNLPLNDGRDQNVYLTQMMR